MPKEFTVIWAAKILANDEKDAAVVARRTIATAPHSYFDVYAQGSDQPHSVEVPNSGNHIDAAVTRPQYPLVTNGNN